VSVRLAPQTRRQLLDPNNRPSTPRATDKRPALAVPCVSIAFAFEAIIGGMRPATANLEGQCRSRRDGRLRRCGGGQRCLARHTIPATSRRASGSGRRGVAGAFPDGSVYLTNSRRCTVNTSTPGLDYGTSNFLCNRRARWCLESQAAIAGGGEHLLHGWNHNSSEAPSTTRHLGTTSHGSKTGGHQRSGTTRDTAAYSVFSRLEIRQKRPYAAGIAGEAAPLCQRIVQGVRERECGHSVSSSDKTGARPPQRHTK